MMCFCGTKTDYALCCEPFHRGLQHATSPQQLMRSRYSAYVVGDYEYVLATYHPSKIENVAKTLQEIREFGEQSCFVKLTVLHESTAESNLAKLPGWVSLAPLPATSGQQENGYVHFRAVLLDGDRVGVIDEVSRFVFEDGRWFYLDGLLQPYQTTKAGRNDSCPCGSGKKFKQCAPSHKAEQRSLRQLA